MRLPRPIHSALSDAVRPVTFASRRVMPSWKRILSPPSETKLLCAASHKGHGFDSSQYIEASVGSGADCRCHIGECNASREAGQEVDSFGSRTPLARAPASSRDTLFCSFMESFRCPQHCLAHRHADSFLTERLG